MYSVVGGGFYYGAALDASLVMGGGIFYFGFAGAGPSRHKDQKENKPSRLGGAGRNLVRSIFPDEPGTDLMHPLNGKLSCLLMHDAAERYVNCWMG